MSELNPNNPVLQGIRDHWHKVAALIMVKMGVTELEVTVEDVQKLASGPLNNIVLDARGESKTGKMKIRLVDDATAHKLAREAGGRAADS